MFLSHFELQIQQCKHYIKTMYVKVITIKLKILQGQQKKIKTFFLIKNKKMLELIKTNGSFQNFI